MTVVDKRDQLLPFIDKELGLQLQKALGEIGLKVVSNSEFDRVEKTKKGVELRTKDGKVIESEMFLYALGRIANVDGLDIEKAGLNVDGKGFIPVNPLFQTIVPNMYAAGDLIGAPALSAKSVEQGRLGIWQG